MAWAPHKYSVPVFREAVPDPGPEAHLGKSGLDHLDGNKAKKLLGVCDSVIDGTNELVKFVDRNRAEARRIGIETISIELSGIIEGGRLGDVRDSLDDAVKRGGIADISTEGLAKLRRAEALLADALHEMDRDLGAGESAGIGSIWIPFAVVGIAAVGLLIYLYQPAPPVSKPLPKAAPKLGSRVFLGSRLKK